MYLLIALTLWRPAFLTFRNSTSNNYKKAADRNRPAHVTLGCTERSIADHTNRRADGTMKRVAILIVEDEALIRLNAVDFLSDEGIWS
jgi:hypothetical protein